MPFGESRVLRGVHCSVQISAVRTVRVVLMVVGSPPAGKCPRCGEGGALPVGADGSRLECRNCKYVFERGRARL